MRGSYLVLFLAACGADDPASSLTVLSVTPENDAVDVSLDTPITLEMSEAPPPDFDAVLTAGGKAIAHTVAIAGTTVTLTPAEPLWIASGYDLAVADFASKFATRDGAWKATALHDEPMMAAAPLGTGASPSLAALPDGTVLASWEGSRAIYDHKLTAEAGWIGMPNKLAISGGDPDGVRIAAASATRAVAGHEKYVTRANIDARTYDGAQWSAPITVAPYTIGTMRYDQYLGGVAATAQTYALVFHRGSFDTTFDLYLSLHTGTWGAPVLVESLPGSAGGADIIADGRGGYVIAWFQVSADTMKTAVYAATVSATGAIGAPQLLDDGPGAAYSLSLARGGETVWIAWAHKTGNVTGRVNARSISASGLGAPHAIDLDGFSAYGEWARIAAGAQGAVLVYSRYGGVYAATSSAGLWSTAAELEPPSAGDVGRPAVTVDDRSNATVIWTRVPSTGRRSTVVARARGGLWSAPAALDDGIASSYVWAAGVDAAGRVTTMWTQKSTDGYAIWGAHLQ